MLLPEPLQKLINAFERLPGIGPKSASRLAFFLLRADASFSDELADALTGLKDKVSFCEECFNITMAGRERCEVCESPKRDKGVICVVEEAKDVWSIEKIGTFNGVYHVLMGALSPLDGIGPEQLRIQELLQRVQADKAEEVIVATDPNVEGDATALYLSRLLKPLGVTITRIASGLPVGGDLEYADSVTLSKAITGRQPL